MPADKSAISEVAVDSGLFPAEHVGELGGMMDEQLGAEAEGHHWIVKTSDGGQVLAAAYYAPEALTDGTWNSYFIAVREAAKGTGLGSALLQHVEEASHKSTPSPQAPGPLLCSRPRQNRQRVLLIETSGLDGFALTRRFTQKRGPYPISS